MVRMTHTQEIQRLPTNWHALVRLIFIKNLNINKKYFEIFIWGLTFYLGNPIFRNLSSIVRNNGVLSKTHQVKF